MNPAVNSASSMTVNSSRRVARSRKNPVAQPRTWEEVDQRLGYIGEAERQLESLRTEFDQKVAVLKQQFVEASQPITREKRKIAEQIECFYWAHRDEVLQQGKKSVELAFGRVGSRRSRSVSVEDAAAAQQWLARHGLSDYLRVRTELDREALRAALLGSNEIAAQTPSDLLACPGIRLRDEEEFWFDATALRRTPDTPGPVTRNVDLTTSGSH
jgi:phage host-nuclease inhibitor protein Gam